MWNIRKVFYPYRYIIQGATINSEQWDDYDYAYTEKGAGKLIEAMRRKYRDRMGLEIKFRIRPVKQKG